jgi:hypothetical protein
MSQKRQAAGSQGDAAGHELRHLAERLRVGDDPKRIADELDRLAVELDGRPRGRPKSPPEDRVMRRLRRALVAEGIYLGVFPKRYYPAHLQEAPGKGSRTDADAIAAEILGAKPRVIQAARKACLHEGQIYPLGIDRRGEPMDLDAWEEFLAFIQLIFRN